MFLSGCLVQLQVCGQQTLPQKLPQAPRQRPCQVQHSLWLCVGRMVLMQGITVPA